MGVSRNAVSLKLKESESQQLIQWAGAFGTPQQVALRCRIVLAAAEGEAADKIAVRLGTNRKTVMLWRTRFEREGLKGLWVVASGRGRKATYGTEKIESIVDATLRSKPRGMTHWSCRLMAERQAVSKSTISNIWRSHNLKPHLTKTFKLSRDAKFLEKLTDVVGLYLNPPEQSIVLCVDEKSQIQALDRTQPGLPIKKGRCGTMTHDYKRNGNDHPVRSPGHVARQGRRRMPSKTPASGISEIPAQAGRGVPRQGSLTSGHGQLRYTQAREGQGVVET